MILNSRDYIAIVGRDTDCLSSVSSEKNFLLVYLPTVSTLTSSTSVQCFSKNI